jgi:hypothetical protein
MIQFKCKLIKTLANLSGTASKLMSKKTQPSRFDKLISSPWGKAPDNSYYGDPRYVDKEQHGLEDIERDKTAEDGVEQVVILGYN